MISYPGCYVPQVLYCFSSEIESSYKTKILNISTTLSKVNEKHEEKPPDTILPDIVDLLHTCELVTKQHPALCVKSGGKYSISNKS